MNEEQKKGDENDCRSPEAKDELYRKLSRLVRSVRLADIKVVADDFNVQFGYLAEVKPHVGGRLSVPGDATDKGDRVCVTTNCSWWTPLLPYKVI